MSALITPEEAIANWEEFQAARRACTTLDEFYIVWNERATVNIKIHACQMTVDKLTQQRRRQTALLNSLAQAVPEEFKKHLP